MNILSVCDGIGLAYTCAIRAGLPISNYAAIEIDPRARAVADWRGQRDGVRIDRGLGDDLRSVDAAAAAAFRPDVIIAGIPCTSRSLANSSVSGAARVAPDSASGLIFDFVERVLRPALRANPDCFFVVENVPSADSADSIYTAALGVDAFETNAAWFSAQSRKRLLWANRAITEPENKSPLVFAHIGARDDREEFELEDALRYRWIFRPGRPSDPMSPRRLGVILPARYQGPEGRHRPLRRTPKGIPKVLSILAALDDSTPLAELRTLSLSDVVNAGHRESSAIISSPPANAKITTEPRLFSPPDRVNSPDCKSATWISLPPANAKIARSPSIQQSASVCSERHKSPVWMANSANWKVAYYRDQEYAASAKMESFGVIRGKERHWPVCAGARSPTSSEIEALFTLPHGELTSMRGLSRAAICRFLGAGFVVDQIAHALKSIAHRPLL